MKIEFEADIETVFYMLDVLEIGLEEELRICGRIPSPAKKINQVYNTTLITDQILNTLKGNLTND